MTNSDVSDKNNAVVCNIIHDAYYTTKEINHSHKKCKYHTLSSGLKHILQCIHLLSQLYFILELVCISYSNIRYQYENDKNTYIKSEPIIIILTINAIAAKIILSIAALLILIKYYRGYTKLNLLHKLVIYANELIKIITVIALCIILFNTYDTFKYYIYILHSIGLLYVLLLVLNIICIFVLMIASMIKYVNNNTNNIATLS